MGCCLGIAARCGGGQRGGEGVVWLGLQRMQEPALEQEEPCLAQSSAPGHTGVAMREEGIQVFRGS